ALFQLKKYDQAAAALRTNLQRFPQSESIQDTQFTLALVLGTDGITALQKATAADPAAIAKLDEGEKLLRDIIAKRVNLAVMNDAQFQLGELLSARGAFTDAEKQKEQKEAFLKRALDAYRSVFTKEQVVQAQKQRIENVSQRRIAAGRGGDRQLFQRLQRLLEKELEKLAAFEGRADQTVTAKIKSGQIFFQLGKLDEARLLLTHLQQFAEDPALKKEILYHITMTYGLQHRMDKAVERYNEFQAAYKGDELGQNLPLIMAIGFLSTNPKANDPEKAIAYCKEGLTLYPKNKFTSDLLNTQASALIQLKRYDEALALLREFIGTNPGPEFAADAQFNLAIIHMDTGKTDEAVKAFRELRDKYTGTRPAEQAAYRIGELLMGSDPKGAIVELKSFTTKFPDSQFMPQALFAMARAQVAANQSEEAIATLRDLPKKFPKSEPAPFSYFERAKIFLGRQDYDQCVAIMKEFMEQFPESNAQFQAYDFIAQIRTTQGKGMDAIATYEDFIQKRPNDPAVPDAILKLNALWKGYADAQGPIGAQNAEKRAEWQKGVDNSIAAAERILKEHSDSPAVALALNNMLDIQKSRVRSKMITEAQFDEYFEGLIKNAEGKPGTQSKIRFTLASYIFEKDKAKAVEIMQSAYNPELKYGGEDLDLYGQALMEAKKYDAALKVYEKLAEDYPLPGGIEPSKAPRVTQEVQAIALAGQGKALQAKGDKEGGAKKLAELEKHYAWSPKMLEVNYGLALDLQSKKQNDEAIKRLLSVIKAPKASAELRAQAMLLLGKIHEEEKRFDAAIDNYVKISSYYAGVPAVAAEGLWRGAQLLERQGKGELPRPPRATPRPKTNPPAKPAAAAVPAAR
ncbi:MAG TPA: tetratricopeptide repeat protein, partial [Chthoniobacteraceae bacterium]|nr:tetratricopeptide repeat protein [Chthoniobacteraceae bacterium]